MRVLIVDDHSMFCDGLKLLLQTLGAASQVVCCTQAEAALSMARTQAWDLVLLDWNMGKGSSGGAELIGRFMALQPQPRVVVVSAECTSHRVLQAVDAGAVGFVPKEASAELLIDAIRITSHGGIYLPSNVLDRGLQDVPESDITTSTDTTIAPRSTSLQTAYPNLTPRQIDVLVCTVKGQSNKVIARELGISDGTVKQHLNAIYREMAVSSRTEAVYLLARQGVQVF